MLRSKSRSGYVDYVQKKHSSFLVRSISGSKLCRGDALASQVDQDALVSLDRNPTNSISLSENRIVKAAMMQKQMDNLEEELKSTKERLGAVEGERNQAISELKETKELASNAAMKLSEALSPERAEEVFGELKNVKASLSDARKELEAKEKEIKLLSSQLENAKVFESKLAEREACIDELEHELGKAKDSEGKASESKKRIQELEGELEKVKVSESKMLESVGALAKKLEESKIELEESKLETASLRKQIQRLMRVNLGTNGTENRYENDSDGLVAESVDSLKAKLQVVRENLTRAQESEKLASAKAKSLSDEMAVLKNEAKLATEAEEKSKKAMDDLAMALKEVATEATSSREKIKAKEAEIEKLKEEVRMAEEKYQKQLDEIKKELDLQTNTADRLRLEAEESLLAWNGKELGFVSCIKRAEEETALVKIENNRLKEALKVAETSARSAREECYKLRDILKQAINESNVAKEASNIARAENSELKDLLAEKEEALHFLTKENERLRINEVAAHENVKEFKRLLSARTDIKVVEEKEHTDVFNSPDSSLYDEHVDDRTHVLQKGFSFDLEELKLFKEEEMVPTDIVVDEDPEKLEALKGSIFDTTASPRSEPQTPKPVVHHRRDSSIYTDAGSQSEDGEHFHSSKHSDDTEERNPGKRRLFRRIGDLIIRRSYSTTKRDVPAE